MPDDFPENTQNPEIAEESRDDRRWWVRLIVTVVVTGLLIGDIALYSLYKTVQSRVKGQDHSIERLENMVTDMLKANHNAEKIERIKTQVDTIGVQVTDLSTILKEQDAEVTEKTPKQRKRKNRRH